MKYFLDTEFIDNPGKIELISIGIVAENGKEYYAVSSEYSYENADDWVKENVIKPIYDNEYMKWKESRRGNILISGDNVKNFQNESLRFAKTLRQINYEILDFIGTDNRPTFYGYYCDYDWVAFCSIFGKMINLPKNFPFYCKDLKQIVDMLGESFTMIDEQKFGKHNALSDAKWNFQLFTAINDYLKQNFKMLNDF